MQQQQNGSAVSFCPSFNCYSTDKLVEIADKVSNELTDQDYSKSKALLDEEEECNDEDDDFEFVAFGTDVIDSRRLFFNGEIRQVFPVFDRNHLLYHEDNRRCGNGNEETHVAALEKLFIDGDGKPASSSSSSSDEDEPERQPKATFCIWSPKRNQIESSQSPSRCKKSSSVGTTSSSSRSPKKWFKIRDLLRRSNSDGKDSFVFCKKRKSENDVGSKDKKAESRKAVSAHEAFYVKTRAMKEGDRRKSYLPYKPDLLGVFANFNAMPSILPPSS